MKKIIIFFSLFYSCSNISGPSEQLEYGTSAGKVIYNESWPNDVDVYVSIFKKNIINNIAGCVPTSAPYAFKKISDINDTTFQFNELAYGSYMVWMHLDTANTFTNGRDDIYLDCTDCFEINEDNPSINDIYLTGSINNQNCKNISSD